MRTSLTMTVALLCVGPLAAQRGRDTSDAWPVLAERYDKDKDGTITPAEYPRGKAKFAAYDANADGVLTKEDFAGSGGMDFGRMMLGGSLLPADGDKDGKVTGTEWRAWLNSLEVSLGVVHGLADSGSEGGRRRGRSGSLDRDRDGKIEISDLEIVFTLVDQNGDGTLDASELEGRPSREGTPVAGDPAPDFELAFAKDEERKVKLSSFAGEKPVALVFGSYT